MEDKKSNLLSVDKAIEDVKRLGPIPFIYRGIKSGSFGYIYGPSKCGKTIYCENLGLSLSMNSNDFLGYPILNKEGGYRVLFISFEEFLYNRTERNEKQFIYINPSQVMINYYVIDDDFPKFLRSKEDWQRLNALIVESEADVVFIDSLTRMCYGEIERSDIARDISLTLKNIAYNNKITMVVIHHPPKLNGKMLTMDSLAGSHVIAQEADFLIGMNKINGVRYIKEVACRYKREEDDLVQTFEINDNLWVIPGRKVVEASLFKEMDGRVDDSGLNQIRTIIIDETEENNSPIFSSSEILNKATVYMDRSTFFEKVGILRNSGEITQIGKGKYKFNNPPSVT